MNQRSQVAALWCLLLLSLTAAAQELHPKLQKKELSIRQVVILPPKVELTKQTMKGNETMLKEAEEVGARLAEVVAKELQVKGIKALDNPFTPAALEENEELKYALADLQTRYDQLAPKMLKKSKDVKQGRYTLGDGVASLNPGGAADALVMIRAYGADPTKGKKAFALLVPFGGLPFSYMLVSLALVDARTGDILCLAKPVVVGNFLKPENTDKVMGKPVAKSLKKLPAAASNATEKKS